MGVTGLWQILSSLSEKQKLSYLSDKRVAVDLSGWVVQAIQCKGLNASKNPHLRNLFFRVSCLLRNGIYPIFVMEGKVPDLKGNAFKERNHHGKSRNENVSRSMFDRVLKQCQDILKSLGVPCIKGSGEAEAFCAFLCANGIVDGVITEDSDAFLYGANPVFREFTIDPTDPHIKVYSLKSDKNKLKLDRSKLIALALLLGCDYCKGVPGIGKETALKLIEELPASDILQRFRGWKTMNTTDLFPGYTTTNIPKTNHCGRCSHTGTSSKHKKEGCVMCNSQITCYLSDSANPCSCPWHKNCERSLKLKTELKIYNATKDLLDFPNLKVVEEFMNYQDKIPNEESLKWHAPNLKEFQEKAFHYLGWTFSNSYEKFVPIITAWQLFTLRKSYPIDELVLVYKPLKILKTRTKHGEDCLEVQWTLNDADDDSALDASDESALDAEDVSTVENENRFKEAYPEIVEVFYSSLKKSKEDSKPKVKATKSTEENQKMTDFYSVRKITVDTQDINEKEASAHCKSKKRSLEQDVNITDSFSKKQSVSL